MNPHPKRKAALKLLSTTGIWKSNYSPPGVRLLWRLGFDCPPPHFARFWSVAPVCGVYFGSAMGLFMWVMAYFGRIHSSQGVLVGAGFAGLFFGLSMATYYALGRRKYRLPLWKDINGRTQT